jgi:IrrE N-terminal-like domain
VRDATRSFISYIEFEHARHDHQHDPSALAHDLGIRVIPSKLNRGSASPPAVITLARDASKPRQRYTLCHEISHVLMERAGLENDILAEVDEDDAEEHLERGTHYAASLLLMPRRMVEQVVRVHDHAPILILELVRTAQASLAAALRRYVYSDADAHRTAFVTHGSYIADVAACNYRLPFWLYVRVPEVTLSHPEVLAHSLGQGRVLGVVSW